MSELVWTAVVVFVGVVVAGFVGFAIGSATPSKAVVIRIGLQTLQSVCAMFDDEITIRRGSAAPTTRAMMELPGLVVARLLVTPSLRDQEHFIVSMQARAARQEGERAVDSLDTLRSESIAWANATFTQAKPSSKAEHLRREAVELCASPSDVEEMADIFILLAHISDGRDLAGAVRAKLEKNKRRVWGKPDADGVVEHVEAPDVSKSAR